MSTLHLPEEILNLIVEHLQLPSAIEIGERRNPDFTGKLSDSDQAIKLQLFTLASLARTSLRLNRIVKPVLYRTYPGFPLANARTFIKTLAKDPVCAGSVHEIVIDKWEHLTQDDQHTVDLESQSLKTSCLQYAQSMRRVSSCYPVGLGSAVGAKLERGRADVVLTMLMLLCDNIEVLEVSVPCLGFDAQRGTHLRLTPLFFMLDVLAYSKDHSEERYRKIRNLAIRLEKHMGVFGCAFANRLLSMPNVETFSGWRVNCSRLFTSRTIGIPDTETLWPGLKSIELRQCQLDNVMLAYLLRRAPNLRQIDLQWAVQEYPLDFQSIAASLNTFGTHLESVRLDTRNNFCNLPEADPEPTGTRIHEAYDEPLGNLQPMTNLLHLAVTPRALVGSHRFFNNPSQEQHNPVVHNNNNNNNNNNNHLLLPPHLQTLHILGPTREDPDVALTTAVYHQILHPAITREATTCPDLRRIELSCSAFAPEKYRCCSPGWEVEASEWENVGPVAAWKVVLKKKKI